MMITLKEIAIIMKRIIMWPIINYLGGNFDHDHTKNWHPSKSSSYTVLPTSTPTVVLLTWPSTNQTPQNWSHDCTLNRLMCTLVCIIWIMHTFQRPTAVSGKWVALNYLNTCFVRITLRQCSDGLEWLMHLPSALALSCPRPLLHRPRALSKPHNAHTTGI